MTISFNRFTNEVEVIVPIINGTCKYNGRKCNFKKYKPKNGWYKISLGNKPAIIKKATVLQIDQTLSNKKHLLAYTFGEEVIPVNFDNLRKMGYGESVKIEFLNLPIFEVAKIVRWDDGRFYFYEADTKFQRSLLKNIQKDFENEEITQVNSHKGITPELTYYYMLLTLERQTYRELERLNRMQLDERERQKRLEQYRNSFKGRLEEAIGKAGGTFVSMTKANKDSYLVTWKTSGQTVKTTIKDSLKVLSAGFCLEGDDKSHSVASLVQLAKMFQSEEGSLYITRE